MPQRECVEKSPRKPVTVRAGDGVSGFLRSDGVGVVREIEQCRRRTAPFVVEEVDECVEAVGACPEVRPESNRLVLGNSRDEAISWSVKSANMRWCASSKTVSCPEVVSAKVALSIARRAGLQIIFPARSKVSLYVVPRCLK